MRTHLALAAPRACRELRTRDAAIRARDAPVRGLWIAPVVDGARTPRVRVRLVELPRQGSAAPRPPPPLRLDRIAEPVVLQPLRGAPHRVDVADPPAERLLDEVCVVPPRAEVLVDAIAPVRGPARLLVHKPLEHAAVRHPLDAELAVQERRARV